MTEQQLQAEIHKIANESKDKIAKLQAALDGIKQAEANAMAEAEAVAGITLRRKKRQAAVNHFQSTMRPQHEATMKEVGDRLADWRTRFNESFDQFMVVAGEYREIERRYDQAMRALYADVAIAYEKDRADVGAGYDLGDIYEQINTISQLSNFNKPLAGLNKKAVEVAGVTSRLDQQRVAYEWQAVWSDTNNSSRLQKIFDSLEIE